MFCLPKKNRIYIIFFRPLENKKHNKEIQHRIIVVKESVKIEINEYRYFLLYDTNITINCLPSSTHIYL